jgi:enoyl-CoA hydratase/carnithine racemase
MRFVTIDIEDRLATLTMAKLPANTMEPEFLGELTQSFHTLSADPAVGAIIVTGLNAVFSAGVDLKSVPGLDVAGQDALVRGLNSAYAAAFGCPKPVVGAINGHAIAGGMVLALCCDYRIAVGGKARFGLTEVRVGVPFPDVPYAVIAHQLGAAALRRFAQFGDNIDAETAFGWGALDEIVAPSELMARAREKALACLAIPPGGYAKVKWQLRGAAVEYCNRVVAEDTDRHLGAWISDEARAAALQVLKGR